jgi:hypothetical protein
MADRRLTAAWAAGVLALLGLTGCATFHSSSIAGYEGFASPLPEPGETLLGTDVKVTGMGATFTNDKTLSVQGTLHDTVTVMSTAAARLPLRVGASAYAAETTVYDYPLALSGSNSHHTYDGWGYLLHARPSVAVGDSRFQVTIGWDNTYNREYGDYSRARAASTNPGWVNLSPHDQSLSTQVMVGVQTQWGADQAFAVASGAGLVLFDWPYRDTQAHLGTLTLLYRTGPVWMWSSWETLDFLNTGVSAGIGWKLF